MNHTKPKAILELEDELGVSFEELDNEEVSYPKKRFAYSIDKLGEVIGLSINAKNTTKIPPAIVKNIHICRNLKLLCLMGNVKNPGNRQG